jgi:alpha-beta hydrolase superfamily lysophospholipase
MFPWVAKLLNEAKIDVATIELPYHMHRRPRVGSVRDFISSDLATMLEATRQAIADIRCFCRWLEEQGSEALGLWGFSLGAWLTGLTVRAERPQFSGVILTTPIVNIGRAIADLAFCAPVRAGLAQQPVALDWLNLTAARPRLAPERILLMESRHDLFAPAETVEELWEAWGRTEIWRLAHGHISVLMAPAPIRGAVAWLRACFEIGRPHAHFKTHS